MPFSRILAVLFTALVCAGCSVKTDLFVQNLTREKVSFKIVYARNVDFTKHSEQLFYYTDSIVNPKAFKKAKNLKALKPEAINDSAIVIEIPENTTTRVNTNHNQLYFEEIDYIEFGNQKLSIKEFYNLTTGQNRQRVFKIDR